MGWFQRLPRQKAGKPVVARTINQIADAAEMSARIRVVAPLTMSVGPFGPIIRFLGPVFGVYIVVTDGTISARVGTTPGGGNAFPQTFNGTVLANLSSDTIKVYSISSTTGGIPTGTYGIAIKIAGVYWLVCVDCGN
jgi:hypothetical protein